jgi:hypothetical protein
MTDRDDDRWDAFQEVYRRPLPDQAGARSRLEQRLAREPRPQRPVDWLAPATFRVRPMAAVAAALALLLAGVLIGRVLPPHRSIGTRGGVPSTDATAHAGGSPTTVLFAFHAPGATRVALVGDFNGWDPEATPLHRSGLADLWTIEIPLARGLHLYAFVVDGSEWTPDPGAPLAPDVAYGRHNSVLVVGEENAL